MIENQIHIIGDSHSVYCFSRIKEAKIHWLGPVTMHRIGRDRFAGQEFKHSFTQGDTFVFIFGEIDVRCHVLRVARLRRVGMEVICEEIASSYIESIRAFVRDHAANKGIVCACPPAGRHRSNPDLPTVGTLAERARVTLHLNARLQNMCAGTSLTFMPFPDVYVSRSGVLRKNFSDGSNHIAPSRSLAIYQALSPLLDQKITFNHDKFYSRLYKFAMRTLPSLNKDVRLSTLEPNPAHTRIDIGYPKN